MMFLREGDLVYLGHASTMEQYLVLRIHSGYVKIQSFGGGATLEYWCPIGDLYVDDQPPYMRRRLTSRDLPIGQIQNPPWTQAYLNTP